MTTANIKIPIERTELLQEKGLLLGESMIQLTKQLYEKDINNENKIN